MIPYLIRRAEESAIISKLTIQNSLLNEEIKIRKKFFMCIDAYLKYASLHASTYLKCKVYIYNKYIYFSYFC